MKQIKTGKQSHLSGASTEKRSILFVSAMVTHSCIKSDRLEGLNGRGDTFGDEDINFNLQLEKFGADLEIGDIEACANSAYLSCLGGRLGGRGEEEE